MSGIVIGGGGAKYDVMKWMRQASTITLIRGQVSPQIQSIKRSMTKGIARRVRAAAAASTKNRTGV